ncbi:MAG: hypothetical protein HYW89_04355 [Candidatus Sungiibacteriota bacterium]|uniref:Uncharacterized protein n=1 Tax=Candidatus Sungiibacteriota bacterium TaxID=2750080 RepID=A0A7T5UR75_9BACT|nr:MAG: hypothetical protein HYW89_04355 [Candidatus Sungbacteria bacterium]
MRTVEIVVRNKDGKLFFYGDGIYFNFLSAFPFWGGELCLLRDGKIIDRARIDEHGTHAPTVCFLGLKSVGTYATTDLFVVQFQEGDLLKIEFLDTVGELRQWVINDFIDTEVWKRVKESGHTTPSYAVLELYAEEWERLCKEIKDKNIDTFEI